MKLSDLMMLAESDARVKFVNDRYIAKIRSYIATNPRAKQVVARHFDVKIVGDAEIDRLVESMSGALEYFKLDEYLEWYVKQFLKDPMIMEDTYVVAQDLIFFKTHKQRFEPAQRDINKFDRRQLQQLVSDIDNDTLKSNREIKKAEVAEYKKDIAVLYDGADGHIYIPKTEKASCFLGRGTRWCTAASNNNMFDNYDAGPLFVFITNNGRKVQYYVVDITKHFGYSAMAEYIEYQFMDEQDEHVEYNASEYGNLKQLVDKVAHDPKYAHLFLPLFINELHMSDIKKAYHYVSKKAKDILEGEVAQYDEDDFSEYPSLEILQNLVLGDTK